ncbi:MAG TPA: prepilin-type N-terminal cleavage/methylation domain-containing protein [Planctomycetota bacterium]|nr:prepilin-type N-terminal cleavage/methylation domain-containing protein [Planctomycetota bacterium]HRR80959.1 prepilin-type N-terminal cleavage/methylation domain-containing protein [Planctomycetota bacterium]HRT94657.1 prepilin-type N-terminal cleavage/methylation domain-containing protein [Planctomycetota bacterium]
MVKRRGRGFVIIEVVTVITIIAVLLSLGYSVYKGARLSARVVVASNNLKQVGMALELFNKKYECYPPEGANLATMLAPFVQNPEVFNNPLADEPTPGKTLSELYVEPYDEEADRPGSYLTAFVTEDGTTAVVLKTGNIVERVDNLSLPSDPDSIVAILSGTPPSAEPSTPLPTTTEPSTPPPTPTEPSTPPPTTTEPSTSPPTSPDSTGGSGTGGTSTGGGTSTPPATTTPEGTVGGSINLNPNNNDDFEFELRFNLIGGGELIVVTRDNLHDGSAAANGYLGVPLSASYILLKPKGNGNQNSLTYTGTFEGKTYNNETLRLENKNRYILTTKDGGTMVVTLYNTKSSRGRAMGKWWIDINAVGAKIQICKCNQTPCVCKPE